MKSAGKVCEVNKQRVRSEQGRNVKSTRGVKSTTKGCEECEINKEGV